LTAAPLFGRNYSGLEVLLACATLTFIIFAFEIARDYNSVLPLMLVSMIADGVAIMLMPKSSIMTEKLARRGMRIGVHLSGLFLRAFPDSRPRANAHEGASSQVDYKPFNIGH
jgi:hypothetical protein